MPHVIEVFQSQMLISVFVFPEPGRIPVQPLFLYKGQSRGLMKGK